MITLLKTKLIDYPTYNKILNNWYLYSLLFSIIQLPHADNEHESILEHIKLHKHKTKVKPVLQWSLNSLTNSKEDCSFLSRIWKTVCWKSKFILTPLKILLLTPSLIIQILKVMITKLIVLYIDFYFSHFY